MRDLTRFGKFFFKSIIALYALRIFERIVFAQDKGQALLPHKPGDTQRAVFVPANSSCDPPQPSCDFSSFWPTFDGTCNNPDKPSWGRVGTVYQRMFKSGYSDSKRKIRVSVVDGSVLPNPRDLRLAFSPDLNVPSPKYSIFSYGVGQCLTHDFTSFNSLRLTTTCCSGGQKTTPSPEGCIPIEVSKTDPFYSRFGIRCLSMTRANSSYDAKCNLDQPCTPFNFVTGLIDQSMVYSNNKNISDTLREMKEGRFKVFRNKFNQVFFSMTTACAGFSSDCWGVPDQRLSVGPELCTATMTFFRFHDILATVFSFVTKGLTDQEIFDRCRRLVIACSQNTYYGEYLPSVLGVSMCQKHNLLPLQKGYTTYNKTINPQTFIECTFCTRIFHSMIVPGTKYNGTDGSIKSYDLSTIFSNQTFLMEGKTCPNLMQSFQTVGCNEQDSHGTEAISNKLFADGRGVGSDLVASDMNRARDMGIPDYNSMRAALNMKTVKRFEDLQNIIKNPEDNIPKLKKFYKSPNDLEVYLMSLLELPDGDAAIGPTCNEVLGRSFEAFKFGDRFFYEHGAMPTSLNLDAVNIIRQIKMCHIICWTNPTTSDMLVADNAYEVPSRNNTLRTCREILRNAPDLAQLVRIISTQGFPPKKSNTRPSGRS